MASKRARAENKKEKPRLVIRGMIGMAIKVGLGWQERKARAGDKGEARAD
ncbi:MAG TPA: hypothetical protein VJ036_01505 [bacterium]|nr:hypothetical protein [bacterium]